MTASSAPTIDQSRRVACQSFQPVYWSAKDTTRTIEQVREHNAAGKALCGW
jgi:hypothetical protein